jgi:DNA-binding FadR family transcriptional regulator
VAADLRRRILSGELEDGAILPKQDDLLTEFGVSLPTLREALRILEAEGLIQVQRGKRGGSLVCRPTAATAAYAIATVLEANQVALPDVAMALQEIEPACLELAAQRPDRHENVVPVLRSLNQRSEAAIDVEDEYRALAHQLHSHFVSASGSQTLVLLAGALEALWWAHARELAAARATEVGVAREVRLAHVEAHSAIIDALEAGESELVRRLSREHLCEATRHSLTASAGIRVDSFSIAPGRFARRGA